MSSSLTHLIPASTQPSQSQRLLKPKTRPIPLLSDPIARTYSFGHTAWLLLYYYLRAGALVEVPLSTLILDLIPVAVGQCMFCAVCLPSSGNWFSGTNAGKIIEGTATSAGSKANKNTNLSVPSSVRKRVGPPVVMKNTREKTSADNETLREAGGSWPSRILPTILSLLLTLAIPPAPLFLLALVLGAPLYPTSLLPHTMLLSMHVSLLAVLPIFYSHGVSGSAWRDVVAAWLPFDEAGVWGGSMGTLIGGWIGAIPMALDWDREWQKWPCTVLWGAVLGWGVGRMLTAGLKLGVGRRINLSEKEHVPPAAARQQEAITSDDKKEA